MKIIFMGTPEFAVPSLRNLLAEGHKIVMVVTQPDKPSHRGRRISMPPIKKVAFELGLPICQPAKIKSDAFYEQLKQLQADSIIVVAFGRILPGRIIYLPPRGAINLHPSLLPKYRGAAPINWAIINVEEETGCTTMYMDEGMDTGDILLRKQVPIKPEDNALELSQKLSLRGAELLSETLRELEKGRLSATKQDNSQATIAPMLKKEDGLIDWRLDAQSIYNRIRGMFPWPGSYTYFHGIRLKILKAQLSAATGTYDKEEETGKVVSVSKDDIIVACGQNSFISLLQLQPQNRSAMSVKEFINGYHPKAGENLGEQSSS